MADGVRNLLQARNAAAALVEFVAVPFDSRSIVSKRHRYDDDSDDVLE